MLRRDASGVPWLQGHASGVTDLDGPHGTTAACSMTGTNAAWSLDDPLLALGGPVLRPGWSLGPFPPPHFGWSRPRHPTPPVGPLLLSADPLQLAPHRPALHRVQLHGRDGCGTSCPDRSGPWPGSSAAITGTRSPGSWPRSTAWAPRSPTSGSGSRSWS